MVPSKRDHSPEYFAIAEKNGGVECAFVYFDAARIHIFRVTDWAFGRKCKFTLLEHIVSHSSLYWHILFLIVHFIGTYCFS